MSWLCAPPLRLLVAHPSHCRRLMHSTARVAYPRSVSRSRTNVAESEVDEKWTKFMEKPDDSSLAPLENVYQTNFGGIRYDTENLAAVHGHDDVFWEAAEMDEVVELPKEFTEADVPYELGNPPKDVSLDSLYFETDDQIRLAKFMSGKQSSRSESRGIGIAPPLAESEGNPIEEQYFPQSTTTATKTTATTATTTTTNAATTITGDEGADDLEGAFVASEQPQEYSAAEPSELSEVDEQYFGGLRGQSGDRNLTVEVDAEDTKSARDLFRDSREGLGFIDAQIFGSEAGDKMEAKRASEKVFEDTKKVEKTTKSDQRTPKTSEKTQKTVKNTPKAVKTTQKTTVKNATLISEHASEMVEQVLSGSPHATSLTTKIKPTAVKIPRERTEAVREPPKKLPEDVVRETLAKADTFLQKQRQNNKRPSERPYMPVKNSALEYVQRLRKEGGLEAELAARSRSKEDEVKMLGVGVAKRLEKVSGGISVMAEDVEEAMAASRGPRKSDSGERSSEGSGSGQYRLKLDDKYKPTDLTKLTSMEMEDILTRAIVLDLYDVVAVNKPFGLEMFGDGQHSLEKYLPKLAARVGAEELHQVHRLDKTTSGVVILAKTKEMHQRLTELFRRREIDKRYWAVVKGVPEPRQGIVNMPLAEVELGDGRHRITVMPDYRGSKIITNKGNLKKARKGELLPAVTEYRVLTESSLGVSLVECKPITGYKHQIRAHLGLGLGCPIVGDHKYSHAAEMGPPQKLPGAALTRLGIRQAQVRHLPLFLHAKVALIPEIAEGKNVWAEAPLTHFFVRFMQRMRLTPHKNVQD